MVVYNHSFLHSLCSIFWRFLNVLSNCRGDHDHCFCYHNALDIVFFIYPSDFSGSQYYALAHSVFFEIRKRMSFFIVQMEILQMGV
ncbi:hypothetical protein GZOEXZXM_CDS0051 [Salmonella phage SeKF_64]